MAKGQMRGNREVRKPKKKKEPASAPTTLLKGATSPINLPKKKA